MPPPETFRQTQEGGPLSGMRGKGMGSSVSMGWARPLPFRPEIVCGACRVLAVVVNPALAMSRADSWVGFVRDLWEFVEDCDTTEATFDVLLVLSQDFSF